MTVIFSVDPPLGALIHTDRMNSQRNELSFTKYFQSFYTDTLSHGTSVFWDLSTGDHQPKPY